MTTQTIRRVVDVIEDCEFMADTHEGFERAAERLGYTTKVLERTLGRAGRYDLVTRMREHDAKIRAGLR